MDNIRFAAVRTKPRLGPPGWEGSLTTLRSTTERATLILTSLLEDHLVEHPPNLNCGWIRVDVHPHAGCDSLCAELQANSVTAQGGPEYCTACKKQFEAGLHNSPGLVVPFTPNLSSPKMASIDLG